MDPVLNVATPIRAAILMININVLQGLKQGANTLHLEGRLQKSECRKKSFKRKQKANRFNRFLLSHSSSFSVTIV